MGKYDASIRIKTDIETDKAKINLKTLENQMEKLQRKTEILSKKKSSLENFTVKTEEYKRLEVELERLKKKYDDVVKEEIRLEDNGLQLTDAFVNALKKENALEAEIRKAESEIEQLVKNGRGFTNRVDTDAYKKICADLENVNNETELFGMKIRTANKQMDLAAENGKKCMDALQRGTKKENRLLTTMQSRLKGIALSLLVFNWISKGFNALVSFMQNGFENLAQYCKKYNGAMSDMKSESATLKNSLAVAFSPIVTMAIPYITKLISWLNTAADSIAQFGAALGGKSVYTRAKKQMVDYAKSLKDASGAAKGTLASFDEINILNKDEGSSTTGGEMTGADAFEEAEVDTDKFAWVDWLRENLDNILCYVGAIGAGLQAWKISSHFTDSLSKTLGIAVAVAGAFVLIKNAVDAWQNGIDWENLSGMLIGTTALIVGLGIAFGAVGAAIGALIAGFVLLTVGFKDILENGVNLQNSLAVIAGVFLTVSAVAGTAIGAITALAAGLVLAIAADWDNFKRNVVEPIWKWLSVLLGNVGETAEGIKQFFSGIIEFFAGVFTGDWKKAWNGIKNIFSGAWKTMLGVVKIIVNTISGIINTMINGLAGAINAVISAINSISFTFPDWIPVLGGKNFSPNIPNIPNPANIPYLATGGTVFQETYAKLSEGNKKEVVLPLEQNTEWADLLAEKIGAGNGQMISIRFEGSLAELGRVLKPVIDQENCRVGRSLAQN